MTIRIDPTPRAYTMFPKHAAALTPDDSQTFFEPTAILVGGAGGTVIVTPWMCDDPVTYDLEPGDWVPVMVSKVASASTATGLIRHW